MDRKPFHGKKLRFQFVSLSVVLSFKLLLASLSYCQPSWIPANECIGMGKYSTGNDAFERCEPTPIIPCSWSNVNQILSRCVCSIRLEISKVPSKIRLAFRKGEGIIGDE
jgi:hypothetical protein